MPSAGRKIKWLMSHKVINPFIYFRSLAVEPLDSWVHRRTKLCDHPPVSTRTHVEEKRSTWIREDTGEEFDEDPFPEHDYKKCHRPLSRWERRICDAWDHWVSEGECPGSRKFWPLTPLWERRVGDACSKHHWFRFRNPPATHAQWGTAKIGNREVPCRYGVWCARHAPADATPITSA